MCYSRAKSILPVAFAAVAFVSGALGLLPAASAKDSAVAEQARAAPAMTTEELYRLYHGRSWLWKDGAGHFRDSKRQFTAWSGSGRDGSYADGVWFLTSGGRACFRADWVNAKGSSKALTCFEHRMDGKTIFQRRSPDGEWYVFRHSPSRAADEARKLKPGDLVARKYDRIKQRLASAD